MPGPKVTVNRTRLTLWLPTVLVDTLERITQAEGWANRQAFIEQAVREKVERWKRENPLGPPPRG